ERLASQWRLENHELPALLEHLERLGLLERQWSLERPASLGHLRKHSITVHAMHSFSARQTLRASHTMHALSTLSALRASGALSTMSSLRSLSTLSALGSLSASGSLSALRTLGTYANTASRFMQCIRFQQDKPCAPVTPCTP